MSKDDGEGGLADAWPAADVQHRERSRHHGLIHAGQKAVGDINDVFAAGEVRRCGRQLPGSSWRARATGCLGRCGRKRRAQELVLAYAEGLSDQLE
jgi:hypothetical protein